VRVSNVVVTIKLTAMFSIYIYISLGNILFSRCGNVYSIAV
jgi:hypothetical protein